MGGGCGSGRRRRTLGVVGTFVLDRIVGLPGRDDPGERLGGIAYGLAAATAAAGDDWRVLPIARLGVDAAPEVRAWLRSAGLESTAILEVPEANNRVELRYEDAEERTERLTGGVGPWSWEELASRASRCDALLVNFISGRELSLETARRLRRDFAGPVYSDLHSLFLGVEQDGTRVPRPLLEWRRWVACFDGVQSNEEELDLMRGDVSREAAVRLILTLGASLVVCTRGSRGTLCWARPGVASTFAGPGRVGRAGSGARDDGSVDPCEIPTDPVEDADPTGCGDVFGGAMCSRLLAGDRVEDAARVASSLAAAAARRSGVDGLVEDLRAEMEEILTDGAGKSRDPAERGGS